jgi:hypothetical protein
MATYQYLPLDDFVGTSRTQDRVKPYVPSPADATLLKHVEDSICGLVDRVQREYRPVQSTGHMKIRIDV